MATLSLKEPGESAFLTITAASRVEGEHGAQIKFESDTGDELTVPLSSVDRQLDRLNVEGWRSLIGKTVKFSRSANKIAGRNPYWNLDWAEDGNGKQPPHYGHTPLTPANGKASETPASTKLEDLVHSYGECLAAAVNQYAPWMKEKGVQVDGVAVVLMAATLFNRRNEL